MRNINLLLLSYNINNKYLIISFLILKNLRSILIMQFNPKMFRNRNRICIKINKNHCISNRKFCFKLSIIIILNISFKINWLIIINKILNPLRTSIRNISISNNLRIIYNIIRSYLSKNNTIRCIRFKINI